MWTVVFEDEFESWFLGLNEDERESVTAMLFLLEIHGPQLSRPYADVIHVNRLSHLKELRIQHRGKPLRAFFAFDPLRQAVVLCAGDKSGNDKRFYREMVPQAEAIYARSLQNLNI